MSKKILVLGGTGAMGVYLVPELLSLGHEVTVFSLDNPVSDNPKLKYVRTNAKKYEEVCEHLKENKYDGIVDFMLYYTGEEWEKFIKLYIANSEHYIFLSTYRVYANVDAVTKETSPRLLDVATDETFLNSNDYALFKAKSENFIRQLPESNWTIVRPAITYSKRRFQLVTLEMDTVVRRMLEKKVLVLPEEAMDVQATMSWAGDVGRMLARLLFNPKAYKETYSVCTSEHHTWREVAEMYVRIGGLKYCTTDTDSYLNIISPGNIHVRQQLIYDRYFDRIMDNSKVLEATGMKQSELMGLEEGLRREFEAFPKNATWGPSPVNDRMDEFLENQK